MLTIKDLTLYLDKNSDDILEKIKLSKSEHLQTIKSSHSRLNPTQVRQIFREHSLKYKKKVITIAALKGGIGKTFLSTNVAIRCAMLGAKTLLLDLDPEACSTNSLLDDNQDQLQGRTTIYDILRNNLDFKKAIIPTKYPGLDLLPSSLRVSKTEKLINCKNPKNILKTYLEELDYDCIFFDLPPSFSTLSGSAYLASDIVILPCTPNIYALESVDLTIEAVNEISQEFECDPIKFQIIFNRFTPHRNASQDTFSILKDDHSDILLPFQIRESADIQNAINAGLSIFEYQGSKVVKEGVELLTKHLCFTQSASTSVKEEKNTKLLQKTKMAYNETSAVPS
jgi:chromosome partitioning protein